MAWLAVSLYRRIFYCMQYENLRHDPVMADNNIGTWIASFLHLIF